MLSCLRHGIGSDPAWQRRDASYTRRWGEEYCGKRSVATPPACAAETQ